MPWPDTFNDVSLVGALSLSARTSRARRGIFVETTPNVVEYGAKRSFGRPADNWTHSLLEITRLPSLDANPCYFVRMQWKSDETK